MRTLVTGATGHIGANLVRQLVEKGERVRIFVRPNSNQSAFDGLDVEKAYGDVTNYESLREAIRGCTRLYHTAGKFNPGIGAGDIHNLMYRVNVEGSENAVKAAIEEGIEKMVFTSTAGTIGWGTKDRPVDEENKYNLSYFHLAPIDTKILAEKKLLEASKKHELPLVIVNPTLPFGPWDMKPLTGNFFLYAKWGTLFFYTEGGVNIVPVADVARGHILAMEKGVSGKRYILGSQNVSFKELFTWINRSVSRNGPWIKIPFIPAMMAGTAFEFAQSLLPMNVAISTNLVRYSFITHFCSSTLAQKELGYSPGEGKKAVAEQAEFMKSRGLL